MKDEKADYDTGVAIMIPKRLRARFPSLNPITDHSSPIFR
jgi:hypothetical protein